MQTVTVTIGRNVGPDPLPADAWNGFVSATRRAVEHATSELWASAPTRSIWVDTPEDAFVFYGPTIDHPDAVQALRVRLSSLAGYYGQEAIGLSVGESELVESVGSPTRVPALVES
jgi:hypothetical protein